MGGSDAYLSDGQAAHNPDLLDIPIAISAQAGTTPRSRN